MYCVQTYAIRSFRLSNKVFFEAISQAAPETTSIPPAVYVLTGNCTKRSEHAALPEEHSISLERVILHRAIDSILI